MDWREKAKEKAAFESIKHVKDGLVIGLGSGSTASYVIKKIGMKIKKEKIGVKGVPTSYQAFFLAIQSGIPVTTLFESPILDLYIDGADQIDNNLNLIKGKGGALTKEKIVSEAAKKFVVVADETKLTDALGRDKLIPIEILPFSEPIVSSQIKEIGGKGILRQGKYNIGPFITDNGNFILDVNFGTISDPIKLESELKLIPGVIETGLFIGKAQIVYLGTKTIVKTLRKKI
jgi:ribose 5-phosphate isomerase A